jgi:hypothetical protein
VWLACSGVLALSALLAGEARADSYAYSYQQLSNFGFTGATVGTLSTSTSTSAVQGSGAIPSGVDGDVQPLDAREAYVGNPPTPAQNLFTPPVGQVNPDYTRGDVLIAVTPIFTISNVAEGYLTPAGAGNSSGQWSVTAPITITGSPSAVTLSFNYTNALQVILTNSPGLASASYEFGFTITTLGGALVFSSTPDAVNNGISLVAPGSQSQPTATGTLAITSGALQPGTYNATITGSEKIFLGQTAVIPEPASAIMLGSGLALALGCTLLRGRKPLANN